MTPLRFSALTLFLALLAFREMPAAPPAPDAPATKPKVARLDDLPRHTYPVTGPVADLVTSPEKFAALSAKVRADVEAELGQYDIQDKTTLKRLKGELVLLDLLDNRNDDARALLAELRDLEDKTALKLTTGLVTLTRLDVAKQSGSSDWSAPAFQQAFQDELTRRAGALPYNVVQDELKGIKAGAELRSRNLILGAIASEIEPAVKKTGSLSDELAEAIVARRASLVFSIPLQKPTAAALAAVIKANHVVKPDIWAERQVTLAPDEKASPVVIGIWDSGVDPAVYPKQMFIDPTAPLDPNGLAYDLHSNRVHGDLYPLGSDANRLPQLKSLIKGMLDLQSAVDSPEADALKEKTRNLAQAGVKPFFEDLELFGNYIHGSHVAGIASAGNPFARLLVARITFDYHLIPEKPTLAQARKDVAADVATIAYFKEHGVRVVNMSWGGSLKDVEDALEKNGVGQAEERKKQAREIFDLGRDGLYNAIKSAPDILFITAAGNSDNDVNFDEVVPSSFDLPNMMTVGAVDQAGDETSFTSFGKNVAAYADGFEVESHIPGGSLLKLSGTSMASPEVANLAAKLIALDPSLKPADVEALIRQGLTPSADNPKILLIDPKRSLDLLKTKLAGKA